MFAWPCDFSQVLHIVSGGGLSQLQAVIKHTHSYINYCSPSHLLLRDMAHSTHGFSPFDLVCGLFKLAAIISKCIKYLLTSNEDTKQIRAAEFIDTVK